MITGLFMGWTDIDTGNWYPICKMTWERDKYYTVYLQGMRSVMEVSESHRTLVENGLVELDRVEVSDRIDVSFRTRMPVNRPFTDVKQLERLGLSTNLQEFDPLEYVSRAGGRKGNDECDLFAEITPDEFSQYHFYFGIGDRDIDIAEYILNRLQVGDKLTLKDRRVYHQNFLLGRAAGYIADLGEYHPNSIDLSVEKINHDVYTFNKVICRARVDGKIAVPFSDDRYQPLAQILTEAV